VPAGRIPIIRPNFSTAAAKLADERDTLRSTNPSDPKLKELNYTIRKMVYEYKKNKWLEHLKEASFNKGPKNLWKTTSQ
jgi:hypothetical protein